MNAKMQRIIDEHDAKNREQVHPTDASEQCSSNSHNNLKLPAIKLPIFPACMIAGLVSVTFLRQ